MHFLEEVQVTKRSACKIQRDTGAFLPRNPVS